MQTELNFKFLCLHKKIYTLIEMFMLCIGWFAILAQFVLMIQNRLVDIPET